MSNQRCPSQAELEAAPLLDRWFADVDGMDGGVPVKVLVGTCTNHPKLREGATCVTSPLVELALDGSWARTHNRAYRLGRPATPAEESAMRHRRSMHKAWTSAPSVAPAGTPLH